MSESTPQESAPVAAEALVLPNFAASLEGDWVNLKADAERQEAPTTPDSSDDQTQNDKAPAGTGAASVKVVRFLYNANGQKTGKITFLGTMEEVIAAQANYFRPSPLNAKQESQ